MKKQFFLFLSAMFLILFTTGCQNAVDVVSPDFSSKANTGSEVLVTPDLNLTLPGTIKEYEPFTVTVDANGAIGKLQLQVLASDEYSASINADVQWITIAEADCQSFAYLTHEGLAPGEYTFRASFVPSDCPIDIRYAPAQSQEEVVSITSLALCDGLTLTSDLGYSGIIQNGVSKEFTVSFTVNACDQDYYNLRLQGGLVAWIEGTPVASGAASIQLNQNNNYRITWEIGEQPAGFSNIYTVTYNYTPNGAPGSTVNISGGWSLVGYTADGTQVSLEIDPVTVTIPSTEKISSTK
jgi:hypothetical protein